MAERTPKERPTEPLPRRRMWPWAIVGGLGGVVLVEAFGLWGLGAVLAIFCVLVPLLIGISRMKD